MLTEPGRSALVAPPEPPRPRRRRRFPEPGIGAILGVAGALLLVWLHHPRAGLYLLGLVLALLSLLRLVLPARDAGLLVVRGRVFDTLALALLAAVLLAMASVTQFPPPGP